MAIAYATPPNLHRISAHRFLHVYPQDLTHCHCHTLDLDKSAALDTIKISLAISRLAALCQGVDGEYGCHHRHRLFQDHIRKVEIELRRVSADDNSSW